MQFESKAKRLYWINSALGLIPDIIITAIIISIIGASVRTLILVVIALQVLYLLVLLRKTIWTWIVFGIYGRKYLASVLTDYLAENDCPEPLRYEKSAEDFLNRIVSDESLPVPLRGSW